MLIILRTQIWLRAVNKRSPSFHPAVIALSQRVSLSADGWTLLYSRGSDYFTGTRRFSSSNQFSTTLICVADTACSLPLSMMNRCPSAVTS